MEKKHSDKIVAVVTGGENSFTAAETLVSDYDNAEYLFKEKGPVEPISGPNTGFFAALSYHDGECDDSWGGDKPTEDFMKELRVMLDNR